ncbi:MAG: carboxypeptidase-like regulatory domain-containing protein [Bacteroidaceae bacterium]|nr:carboxypeptidase-like regulatory domain-containing protein [Bacteroidaceae bacterium]
MPRLRHLIALLLVMVGLTMSAEELITISGIVTDRQTRQPLPHVSVVAVRVGTVTNDQGRFTLKVSPETTSLTFSLIGYLSQRVDITRDRQLSVELQPSVVTMDELVVRSLSPWKIVSQAISRFPFNYSQRETSYYGFYREVMQKRRQYISISEAVVELYKTVYNKKTDFDAVAIRRGRRMMNIKSADTLAVKLQGGPTLPILADVVKNIELLFYPDDLTAFDYSLEGIQKLDDRMHYVIQMTPRERQRPYALFYATLYIDQHSLAISRADLSLDLRNRALATNAMLVYKPAGLRFTPLELTMNIYYRTEDGITYLNYVRNEIRFKCDWSRRLFASPFTVVSEFVVTNILQDAQSIRGRDSFRRHDNLYDNVDLFSEPDFWGPDNIIEPTESLNRAIDRLRRSVERTISN